MQKMRIDPKTIQPKCVFCILYIFEGFCYYILYIDPTSPPALPDIPMCLRTNINLDTWPRHAPLCCKPAFTCSHQEQLQGDLHKSQLELASGIVSTLLGVPTVHKSPVLIRYKWALNMKHKTRDSQVLPSVWAKDLRSEQFIFYVLYNHL